MDRFEEAKAAGDEVVAILISGLLSGTYQSARIAADSCEYDKIHLVDSMNATLGEQLLVRLAVQMRADGATAGEIVAELERRRMDVRLVAVVDDLKYFRKGGRLTGAQALAGSLLGVKPVVAVRDGKVGLAGKARGMPGAYVALFKLMDTEGGLDETMPYMIGYTAHRKAAEPIHRYLTQNLGLEAPLCRHIGTPSAPTRAPARRAWPSSPRTPTARPLNEPFPHKLWCVNKTIPPHGPNGPWGGIVWERNFAAFQVTPGNGPVLPFRCRRGPFAALRSAWQYSSARNRRRSCHSSCRCSASRLRR